MKKIAIGYCLLAIGLCACTGKKTSQADTNDTLSTQGTETVEVKYATGFSVKDSADIRLVDVGKKDHFALVRSNNVEIPAGYTKVVVPIQNTICMTALQLSNFTSRTVAS